MAKVCKHNVRETLRAPGVCDIRAEVKQRNGDPKWWCRTHGMAAGGPGGVASDRCPGSWLDPVADDMRLDLDLDAGQVAIWGALPPAISMGTVPTEPGGVHVHQRLLAGGEKSIDRSYAVVVLRRGGASVTVEGMAAVAWAISELSGKAVKVLVCSHCGERHIDEQMFAALGHRKHQCNACGRHFFDSSGPSIGNPLADATAQLGLPAAAAPVPAPRTLALTRGEYDGVALWPSNSAIVNTMGRPEECGIHVHAWRGGVLVIDETYGLVTVDGREIDQQQLRLLAIQRSLPDHERIQSLVCEGCGAPLISPTTEWLQTTTRHACGSCGRVTRTRRKVFVNPLADL